MKAARARWEEARMDDKQIKAMRRGYNSASTYLIACDVGLAGALNALRAHYLLIPKEEPGRDAWRDVLAERQRQVEVEGWTPEHDDAHTKCEMSRAAASYALQRAESNWRPGSRDWYDPAEVIPFNWPWARSWWKPTTYRRNLVKAAALILAEIERLDRTAGGESDG